MHALALAEEIGIPRVLVPRHPGNFSALGLLASDIKHDDVRTRVGPLRERAPLLADLFAEMEGAARRQLEHDAGQGLLGQDARVHVHLARHVGFDLVAHAGEVAVALEREIFLDQDGVVRSLEVEVVSTDGRKMRAVFCNRGQVAGDKAFAVLNDAGRKAVLAVPSFASLAGRPTDWNDLQVREGDGAVCEVLRGCGVNVGQGRAAGVVVTQVRQMASVER